jgi:hypothetical protein
MAKPLKKQNKPEPKSEPKQENPALNDFLAKLTQHNIPETDAATTAKYHYNQPELSRLTATQLDSLFQRLLSRMESDKPEAAVISITTEAQPTTTNPQPTEEATAVVVVEAPAEIEVSAAPEPAAEVVVVAPEEIIAAPEVEQPAASIMEEPIQEVVAQPVEIVAEVVAAPTPKPASEVSPVVETPIVAGAPAVVEAPVQEVIEAAPVVEAQPVAETPAPQEAKVEAKAEEPEEEEEPAKPVIPEITEPRYWRKNGWSAKVIKNEDDDGWAIEISKEGVSDPVLVSPWVMGRDKKNPKPIDSPSFATFVKTASEVIRRAEQQRERALKRMVSSCWDGIWYKIVLQIIPDEYDPYAILSASGPEGDIVKLKVAPNYKLTQATADKWVRGGFKEM